MQIEKYKIRESNGNNIRQHKRRFEYVASEVKNVEKILQKLADFQVAIPGWALGTGGTRFGRFPGGGEPRTLITKHTFQ